MTRARAIVAVLALCYAPCVIAQPPSAVHSFVPGSGQSSGQEPQYFPANVLGLPDTSARRTVPTIMPEHIASLGLGGEIVLRFDPPIIDGAGPDFTVFENAFYYMLGSRELLYAEPAIVAVSRDGITFTAFAFDSLSLAGLAGTEATFGNANPFDPRVSGGNSFDLADAGIDSVAYVRLTDVTAFVLNNESHPNWDATLSGFDLDAVLAIPIAGRESTASIESRAAAQVMLTPNPATTHVRVHVPDASRVRVINQLGAVVLEQVNGAVRAATSIDIRDLPDGSYVVVAVDERGVHNVAALRIAR